MRIEFEVVGSYDLIITISTSGEREIVVKGEGHGVPAADLPDEKKARGGAFWSISSGGLKVSITLSKSIPLTRG